MAENRRIVHPYIPNSVPEVKARMLEEIGIKDIDELYQDIPENLRLKEKLNLPQPFLSEYELKRHVEGILAKNCTCREYTSFLGGGCYQHYVPAICDEIAHRSEFLTAYAGEPYEDQGRFQALFEYESLMAELLDTDVVNVPNYDWCQAASTSLRMACRIVRRREILVSDTVSPDRLSAMKNYCSPTVKIEMVPHDRKTGMTSMEDLESRVSKETACIYLENPSYLGPVEMQGKIISDIAHEHGALCVVGVDPISLGVIAPPSSYGADITCGDIQSLGMHMNFGGGHGGFIATQDKKEFVMEYPSRLFGMTRTSKEGEYGFGDVAYERTSFAEREGGKEFVGTAAALWGITAGVYLSLLGPRGIFELGKTIMQKSQYAVRRLSEIEGIKAPHFQAPHFKEFVVDFKGTGRRIAEINRVLFEKRIFGGKDLSHEFEELFNCALFCITEIHTREDIDTLADVLKDCLGG